ncbi:hypothetical protein [endosymbiont GvMRE of Glomus versiforme]|uniref:hypothetical protein n=1 Tax=endosymbiont GvMRE of Glomus versiforme TaxID=2039283 RepID=UPI000EDD41DD|nr:hypothetical protein [endosymbiont GvMRE of Glomus versiforme]RHZ36171.1 hypothetical protein GvMRE_Ic2g140 [endosymbiont GvMRE of Glomus versiforme]
MNEIKEIIKSDNLNGTHKYTHILAKRERERERERESKFKPPTRSLKPRSQR